MSRRRTLPEDCYDFWVRDSRDGACTPPRASLKEAQRDRRRLLKHPTFQARPWQRRCLAVQWRVNERKVLKYVRAAWALELKQ